MGVEEATFEGLIDELGSFKVDRGGPEEIFAFRGWPNHRGIPVKLQESTPHPTRSSFGNYAGESDDSMATSVPVPMAIPKSAWTRAARR
jgi:hypothetical protein